MQIPSNRILLPYISLQPNRITTYFQSEGKGAQTIDEITNVIKPKNNDPKRGLSKKARKRIQSKINWLLTFSKTKRIFNDHSNHYFTFKINFITLTLPVLQFHTDKTIKSKCLNQFITELRQHFELRNYIWRAEAQSNGSIHFHFATDTYIPWFVIRRIWNRQIAKLGYIAEFKKKFSNMKFEEYERLSRQQGVKDISVIMQRYSRGQKTNWSDPNTTDIHSVTKIRNLAAYMAKYMSKDEGKKDKDGRYKLKYRKMEGRIWGCSESLSRCKSIIDHIDNKFSSLIGAALAVKDKFVLVENYFTFISCEFKQMGKSWVDIINKLFLNYKRSINYESGGIPNKRYNYTN